KLAHAIQQTVASVTISVGDSRSGDIRCDVHTGELCFREGLGLKSVLIPDEAIGTRKIWREFGELVREAEHPLHLADFAKYINTPDLSLAAYHVRRAEKAGLIRKIGCYGGWVAVVDHRRHFVQNNPK